tara:strand:+ start:2034 stop:2153 length:120 start_codon:yes stop_codon:yes gene_type:complete
MSNKKEESKKTKTETPKSEVKIERPQSVLIKNSMQIKKK